MASRMQPKEPTLAATVMACLVGAVAWILIGSIYVGNTAGWPQFVLSVFSALTVCAVGAWALAYAAHQQFVAKRNLFVDDRGPHRHGEFSYRSTGQWAVITGATDGIGKEYARQLAVDHGMDVLLVGRNPDKLISVAQQIREETRGRDQRVMTVIADLAADPVTRDGQCCGAQTAADDADDVADRCHCDVADRCHCDATTPTVRRCARWYPRLRAVVNSRDLAVGGVGVLVNCAGACYPHPEFFVGMAGDRPGDHATSATDVRPSSIPRTSEFCDVADTAIRCNAAAAMHVCRLVLPGMLDRGRGLVINVGSASASVPAAPLMAVYAATKKFLEKLSADLDDECVYLTRKTGHPYGVRVQCVRPAYVATAMLRSANPDVRIPDDDSDDNGRDIAADDVRWWTEWKRSAEKGGQTLLVPTARRWVRSALKEGAHFYTNGSAFGGPANFTGYPPHTLLVWTARLISAIMPRRWFINLILIPSMLVYRAKGREAILTANQVKFRDGRGPSKTTDWSESNQTASTATSRGVGDDRTLSANCAL